MSVRIQIVLDEAERDRFKRRAAAENMTLSAWLRAAARERMRRRTVAPLQSVDDLRDLWRRCDDVDRELEREPDWDEHRAVIDASRGRGRAES